MKFRWKQDTLRILFSALVFIRDSKLMFVAVLIDIVLQPQQSLQLRISGEDINFSYPSRPQGEPFEMEV